MKIACISDIHCHMFKEFDKGDDITGSTRFTKIMDTLRYVHQFCKENDIGHILMAGDLFNVRGKISTVVYNHVHDVLQDICTDGINIIAIPGNHDQVDNSDVPQHSLYALKDIQGLTVQGELGMVHLEKEGEPLVNVFCVPYSKNAQMIKDYVSNVSETLEEKDSILMFHLGINGSMSNGVSLNSESFNIGDLYPDKFKYLVGGHIHKRQFFGSNAFYCGSPIQHSHNDGGESKGFFVIDTNKKCDIQFVHIPNPEFVTLTGPFSEIHRQELEQIALDEWYVRVILQETELQGFLAVVPSNLKYKVILQKSYKEEIRCDVKIGMSFEEIISKYAEEYKPEAKDIGLKILSDIERG